ncbi:2-C-methyl-D-erythritol 2,4-cyclodiphosphate synthase [Facilibium subflavum]|uniref:2-C-methyl-D-erythritol 2,4-cyclodiphosphate synthase n=1 Tax=Facilibium subflavum TaxID=2219058 RepID=UPI000E651384|nr:2-C-methyl-D-erythritol 2,4-cyclodiphosphate synthase [Facilibium subflavum]
MFRIGHGYDVHQIVKKQAPLFLGGIEIPADFSLKAHSDGDVVLHALTDALLGAAALGDIGQHFPDTDKEYKNKQSRFFVQNTIQILTKKHYQIGNIDITIAAQAPKLSPFIQSMRQCIAQLLNVDLNQVNIKATTTEKLGFVGRKEGIACYAVALLIQQ